MKHVRSNYFTKNVALPFQKYMSDFFYFIVFPFFRKITKMFFSENGCKIWKHIIPSSLQVVAKSMQKLETYNSIQFIFWIHIFKFWEIKATSILRFFKNFWIFNFNFEFIYDLQSTLSTRKICHCRAKMVKILVLSNPQMKINYT